MGGSLAGAVSTLHVADRVTGWSPNATERDAALTAGAVQFVAADWRHAAADADVVVLAATLGAALDLLGAISQVTFDETTMTDVVAARVESGDLAALERLLRDTRSWRART